LAGFSSVPFATCMLELVEKMMGNSFFHLLLVLVIGTAEVAAVPAAQSKDMTRCFSVNENGGSEQLCLVVIHNSHCHAIFNNATCSSCTSTYPFSCQDSGKLYKDFGYHVDCSMGNLHPEYADLRVCNGVVEVGSHDAYVPPDENHHERANSAMNKTMWIVGAVLVLGFLKCKDFCEHSELVFKYIRRLKNPSHNTEYYNEVNAMDGVELVSEFEPPAILETTASSTDQTA